MSSEFVEMELAPAEIKAGHLVTAQSYLIDRIVPDCEIIALPGKSAHGGRVRFRRAPHAAPARAGGLAGLIGRTRPPRQIDGWTVLDFRTHHPQNWAHFLNDHLPLFFKICDTLDLDWADTLIVTPENTPDYIHAAAEFFGVQLLASDAALRGDGIEFEVSPWVGMRAVRADWARLPRVTAAVAAATAQGMDIPRRVFLARRGTRNLSNQAEVDSFLAARGFVTIYPEEMPVRDQFRLFRDAETIVAVHGAGLAPLLYRPGDARLHQLIEILPCGHMTDVFRLTAQQVDVAWIGVRGRLKPAYVAPAYDLDAVFKMFSLDSFSVDTRSLAQAFALAEHPIEERNDV